MPTLAEIRQKYPQYNDMSDEQLANNFHNKFYSDIPREEFNKKIGYQPEEKSQGYFQKLGSDLSGAGENTLNSILGFGDAARNAIASGLNIIPGVNISKVKSGEGKAYDVGNIAGELGTFLGGGEVLDALRAAGKLGTIAKGLEGTPFKESLKRIIGSSAYGGLTNEDNRALGAGVGAGLGILGEAIPFGAGVLTQPRKAQSNIKNYITGQLEKASSNYGDVLNKLGDERIYQQKIPVYGKVENYGGNYNKLNKDIFGIDSDLAASHNVFSKNPTLQNAHQLQSDLGKTIASYDKANAAGTLLQSEKNSLKQLQNARKGIKNDIDSFLNKSNPDLADKYQNASDIYKDVIEPSRKLNDELNPKEFANKLDALRKKEKLSPEFKKHLSDLNSALLQQKLGLGTLGAGLGSHFLPTNELIETALLGKLSGIKSPTGLSNIGQAATNVIGQGGKSLADVIKPYILGQMAGNNNGT